MDKRKLQLLMGSYAPYPGVYVYDKFTDANDVSLDAHILDKPKTALWSEVVGTWDIQTNQANAATISGYAAAVVESGYADCTVSVIVKSVINANNAYIVFRYVDGNNYLTFNLNNTLDRVTFAQKVSGSITVLLNENVTITTGNDYVLSAILSGNTVKCYIDGVLKIDTTNNNLLTATKHGILSEAALQKFDEFQVSK